MERSWWGKFFVLVCFLVFAGIYVYPTVADLDLKKTNFPFKQKINLGLDLQGGLYMVLGIDFDNVYKDFISRQSNQLEDRLKEKSIKASNFEVLTKDYSLDDPRITFEYPAAEKEAVQQLIKDEFWSLRLTGDEQGHFQLGVSRTHRKTIRENTLNQSIEVIRNRIDEFGVSEPSITSQGADRIVVELPGVKDVERAKSLIGRTAKLEFKMVNDKDASSVNLSVLMGEAKEKGIVFDEEGTQKFSDYVRSLNEFLKVKLPKNTEISFERIQGKTGKVTSRVPYLIFSKTEVTGEDLQDAQVQYDPDTRMPAVSFSLSPRGAVLFDKLTGDNIGNRLAIVLDNIVFSAPTIQSRIGGGRGQITLGRGSHDEVLKEANDLAIVLRAGALPAQLEFMEQRVVGPSLGQDSIRNGSFAGIIGAALVFLFMVFYYRVSGVIAVASLTMNVLFVMAILVGLGATLTLPGIAGIALTIGIAVDSNVVIYERIREEVRSGKKLLAAVESGFQKAFRTIFDANITNAAAAGVLLMYGTGPIKGFAVTLLIGIVCTLFTAVFVCRLLFELYLKMLEKKTSPTLSI